MPRRSTTGGSYAPVAALAVDDSAVRADSPKPVASPPLQPPRWTTPEFYLYYAAFVLVVPYMVYTVVDVSSDRQAIYPAYSWHLSPGFFGRSIDNSDLQYAGFRNNLPALVALLLLHVGLSYTLLPVLQRRWRSLPVAEVRAAFTVALSSVVLFVLFGFGLLKLLAIVSLNYLLGRATARTTIGPLLTWAFGIGMLFLNDRYQGYDFGQLHPALSFMEDHTGLLHRWQAHFNFTMLRMVSYNMDYRWFVQSGHDLVLDALADSPDGVRSEKDRIRMHRAAHEYGFMRYLAYLLYMPLFLAGPIITFNDFMSQLNAQVHTITLKRTVLYGLRLLGAVMLMELMMHYIYVVAISKAKAWEGLSAFQVSMVGFFNLNYIWLKLLIIWRFFRFWALCDGIETQENMIRCMSNNYSAIGFWRSWHRSYNRWLIRYLYIPLGGTRYMAYNIWVVFTFVAVWHDISLQLLAWGWLISLFILPEIVAKRLTRGLQTRWYYRHLAAWGGVFNILLMMAANLVGFAVGLEGVKAMASEIFTLSGLATVVAMLAGLFVGVQLMFEVREEEARQGGLLMKY